jgi:hypothetical protein
LVSDCRRCRGLLAGHDRGHWRTYELSANPALGVPNSGRLGALLSAPAQRTAQGAIAVI